MAARPTQVPLAVHAPDRTRAVESAGKLIGQWAEIMGQDGYLEEVLGRCGIRWTGSGAPIVVEVDVIDDAP